MNKTIGVIGVVAVVGAFAAGRATSPEKIVTKTEVQKIEIVKQDLSVHKARAKRTSVKILPTGEKSITIEDIIKTDVDKTDLALRQDQLKSSSVVENRSKFLLHGLLGVSPDRRLSYGAGLSYRILGPIRLGAAYMQNQPAIVLLGVDL